MPNPNINRRVVLANGMRLDPSTQSVVDRMAALGSAPSIERQMKMNSFVLNLKGQGIYGSANVWNKLDILQPYYAETSTQALVEWKMKDGAGVYDATAVNSPTFTANVGYKCNGAGNRYIRTNFKPSQGTNYTLNSNCFGAWGYDLTFGSQGYLTGIDGTFKSWIRISNNLSADQRNNANTNVLGNFGANSEGLHLSNRTSSSEFKLIKNGTVIQTITQTSAGLETTFPFTTTGYANGATSGITNDYGVKFWIAGGDLEADRSQLYNSLLAYIS